MLCTPATTPRASDIPTPADARQAVVDAIEARSGLADFGQTLALPEVTARALPRASATADREGGQKQRAALGSDDRRDGLPAIIRSAVERRGERIITARVKRLKVMLIAD